MTADGSIEGDSGGVVGSMDDELQDELSLLRDEIAELVEHERGLQLEVGEGVAPKVVVGVVGIRFGNRAILRRER